VEGRIKRNEKWGTKDMEHQDWLCNIIDQHIKFHPSDDFTDIFNTTHPNRQLTHYDSHTALRQYPTPHRVKSCRSSHLSIFYPNFPWWVTVVSFYYSFSFWFIIWFVMLLWKGTFWNFPLTHWWAIAYWSLKCCLVVLHSLMYIRRLSCLRERTIKFRFQSQLSFFQARS